MRAVIQRVVAARVEVEGEVLGSIERGLLVYLGVAKGDGPTDSAWLADKVANLRIFEDNDGKMNLSLLEVGGSALVISQFTLLADARKGRRPSWSEAEEPGPAKSLYEAFVTGLGSLGVPLAQGRFQAEMAVTYTNQGPVTLLLDSKKNF